MQLNPTNFDFFFNACSVILQQAYEGQPVNSGKFVQVVPCTTETMTFAWLGKLPRMREWVGPRTVHSLGAKTYQVSPKPFENTIEIDKFKLEDDQFGVYYTMVQQMGQEAAKLMDYEIRDLLIGIGAYTGTAQNGLDGGTHFNVAHNIDINDSSKGTFCNDYRGGVSVGGITVGGALSPTAYSTMRADMLSRKGENGETLGVNPDSLIVGPQNESTGLGILNNDFFAPQTYLGTTMVGSSQNTLKGTAQLIMFPELSHASADPTDFYLMDCSKAVKPLMWALRQAPVFVQRISPTDPNVFDTHQFLWGSEARAVPAWGHAFLSSVSGA
jgi:phage major head subunit gpT-like protein